MPNKPQQPIKDALGLGEQITFSDRTQLNCVPATLADLEDVMGHWQTFVSSNLSIQGCYLPGNEEVKKAFEELLFIACGRTIPIEELKKKINMADPKGVHQFINRFLGFELGSASDEESEQ